MGLSRANSRSNRSKGQGSNRSPRRGSTTGKRAEAPRRRFRSGLTVRFALVAATLGAGGALAYIPVTDYFELNGELSELEAEGNELETELDEALAQKEKAESENALRARCYNNYVEPGMESYAVPGLAGCTPSP